MRPQMNTDKHEWKIFRKSVVARVHLWTIVFAVFLTACSELEKPKPEPFYAETAPPPKKEFRWSNGKTPKSFDPAKAAAPPETDVVRAVYEGLTETDPKTLKPLAAAAIDWNASEDLKTWTFDLRKNAKWSNGETVTANDFVRSWQRLAEMGDNAAHRELTRNIVGFQKPKVVVSPVLGTVTINILPELSGSNNILKPLPTASPTPIQSNSNSSVIASKTSESNTNAAPSAPVIEEKSPPETFGVEAIDDYTLKVSLLKPDKDFPSLVAHPIFRPIYDGKEFETNKLNAGIVTNGAFRITSVGQDGITLDRAENYWNRAEIELERVKLVPSENAEKALDAYRKGDLDAVTNADFEPLALKLLATYEDFRPTAHAAINFYEFNQQNEPFNDQRVREALAIAVERERITEDEMDGASESAFNFLPFGDNQNPKLVQNAQKAKELLAESGFPDGADFPTIRLLINRNNVQQKIARSVAKMWKKHLNVETEIVAKDAGELDAAWQSGEFDLLRRGVVLPTTDETVGMSAIFPPAEKNSDDVNAAPVENSSPNGNPNLESFVSPSETPKTAAENALPSDAETKNINEETTILTEAEAMREIPAIPLYFPTSYSLVKPYIQGFDINALDAPLLKNVKINNDWQPKTPSKTS